MGGVGKGDPAAVSKDQVAADASSVEKKAGIVLDSKTLESSIEMELGAKKSNSGNDANNHSAGSGGRPPNGDGGGSNNGSGSSPDSPFEPMTHQVFRIVAFDHRSGYETKNDYKLGIEIPLEDEIVKRAPPPDVAYKIQNAIKQATARSDSLDQRSISAKRLEVDVALYFGPTLTNFNAGYIDTRGKEREIDVMTDSYLIEVTIAAKGKSEQITEYLSIANKEKAVILYAPKYKTEAAIEEIKRKGAYVARNWNELTKIVRDFEDGEI